MALARRHYDDDWFDRDPFWRDTWRDRLEREWEDWPRDWPRPRELVSRSHRALLAKRVTLGMDRLLNAVAEVSYVIPEIGSKELRSGSPFGGGRIGKGKLSGIDPGPPNDLRRHETGQIHTAIVSVSPGFRQMVERLAFGLASDGSNHA